MLHTKILPVPPGSPQILDGHAIPVGPHVAQAQPLAWRGDTLELCKLTVDTDTEPDWSQVRWGEARALSLGEIQQLHKDAIAWALAEIDAPFEGVVAGPVMIEASWWQPVAQRRNWDYARAGRLAYDEVSVWNNHEVTGPVAPVNAQPQRLQLDHGTYAPWDLSAPYGPLGLPGSLLRAVDYDDDETPFPYDRPYGAVGSGEGANPWGLVQGNRYLTGRLALQQLALRGTGALYERGLPPSKLPAGAVYRLDGPSHVPVCHGWDKHHDPLGWHQQDYSKTTHGVIDSQHMSRTLGLLYPAAYLGGERWAINEIRCLAQTIVLCYDPAQQQRFGREDAWRMHAVAAAVHLTPPSDPMRPGWTRWLEDMAVCIAEAVARDGFLDVQWGHHHLPADMQGPGFGLCAPWEWILLLSGLTAARRVTMLGSRVDEFHFAARFLLVNLDEAWGRGEEGRLPYKFVVTRAAPSQMIHHAINQHPNGTPQTDGEFYMGLLGCLSLPEHTGLDLRRTPELEMLTKRLQSWAAAQGKTLAQCFPAHPHSPSFGCEIVAKLALSAHS
jgi:hypothetical protein